MFDSINVALIIPRSIEIGVYGLCAYLIMRKIKRKEKDAPGNILKKNFFFVFIMFSLVTLDDMINSLIAGIGIPAIPGTYIGYDINYPFLFIANIIRDLWAIPMALVNYFTFRSIKIIQHGEQFGTEIAKKKVFIAYYVIMMIVFASLDILFVIIRPDLTLRVEVGPILPEPYNNLAFITLIMYLITFCYSFTIISIIFFKNLKKIQRNQKVRLGFFLLGYTFLFIGVYHFGVTRFISPWSNPLAFQLFGHTMWSIAPIFFSIALSINPIPPPTPRILS